MCWKPEDMFGFELQNLRRRGFPTTANFGGERENGVSLRQVRKISVPQYCEAASASLSCNIQTKMRVVFDTNVLVAAARSRRGASYALVSSIPSPDFQLCLSQSLYMEWQ